jgi:hypothetical protein
VAVRDIYLKIETIPGYSPVEPDDHVSPDAFARRGLADSPLVSQGLYEREAKT